ncbi:hypothetical protein BSKO_07745 [Bryopsis sp. KO-2023]|nr:hypothetical protein BSKO_07745 [Bryopsis sp. KO-2023]
MVCFNLYIFDRRGTCLYYQEWYRSKSVKEGAGSAEDDRRQLFALFWTIRSFTSALDPKDSNKPKLGTQLKIGEGCSFHSFKTNVYKFHFLESPSGLKFVLNTTPDLVDLRDVLDHIYGHIYVEYVTKNPLYLPGSPFNFENFTLQLNQYMKSRGLAQ